MTTTDHHDELPGHPADYHGPHVAHRTAGHEPIEWHRTHTTPGTARVIAHTCECKATIYELCNLGGGHYIRRTTRGPITEIHQTAPCIRKHADHLWQRLLRGEAR